MNNIKRLLIVTITIGLLTGCWDDNTTSSTVKTSSVESLDRTVFDANTGAVTKDTEIKSTKTGTSLALSSGTVLQDEDGNPITKAPEAKVAVEKSETEAKTTLDLTVDGKKVIPTESVVMSVPAPSGAKVGDEVQIDVPDDGTIGQQKLMFFIVQKGGFIMIRLFPKAFHGTITIAVAIKIDKSTN